MELFENNNKNEANKINLSNDKPNNFKTENDIFNDLDLYLFKECYSKIFQQDFRNWNI